MADKYMEQAIDLFATNWLEKEEVTDAQRDFVRRLMETDWPVEFAVTRQAQLLESRASELRLLDMLRRINQECNCPFCEGPSVGVGHADFCELMNLLAQYKDVKTEGV